MLDAEQSFSDKLKRKRVGVALRRFAASLSTDHGGVVSSLPAEERELIGRLTEEEVNVE